MVILKGGFSSDLTIIRAAIATAKAFSLDIVVEGGKTEPQHRSLVKDGCDKMQGYYFGRPMGYDELIQYVRETV